MEKQSHQPHQRLQASNVEALLRAGERLLAGNSASPRLDAEILLAWTLDCGRTALFTGRDTPVPADKAEGFMASIRDRQSGRPVAQIVGQRAFWTLDLKVSADVLIPRPETELLVERALARLPGDVARRVLDLGTGSGAIALAIASERPACQVLATDRSEAALAVARDNAAAHQLMQVTFMHGDWFAAAGEQKFEVIASNPPYIADSEWSSTDRELAFEPRAALAAGPDGLDDLRRIVQAAPAWLERGGWLLLEHGSTQGEAVRALLAAAGFISIATSTDLAGLPRVTEGQRP